MSEQHSAAQAAAGIVAAGWPVVPIATDTDGKRPTLSWRNNPITHPREIDPNWPRWAAVCGVQRESDGRALVCVDADSEHAAATARSVLSGNYTHVKTGRPGGWHVWCTLPADAPDTVRRRFYIAADLDWRADLCIALLPGSIHAPVSAPGRVYAKVAGPDIPHTLDAPSALVQIVAKRSARLPSPETRRRRPTTGARQVGPGSAFARFLGAAQKAGRTVRRDGWGRAFVSCPGSAHPHGNRRPALLVTSEIGRVGIHCFAHGCNHLEILDALGLEPADLFDPVDPAWSNLEIVGK